MNSTLDFLKRVLPSEGNYAAFIQETKTHLWFATTDQLGAAILAADARGQTVYHACSSFAGHTRRLTKNAANARSFWLDVDAGEGKPYADVYEAADAVAKFAAQNDLPPPLYVASGNGLHLYWPLAENLGPDTWKAYATGLKRLCAEQNLHIDPARATDLASILRTPGTHNRKSGRNVEVQCGPLVGPYPLDQFKGLLNGHVETSVHERRNKLADALGQTYSEEPRNLAAVAQECAQVRDFRERKGQLPEPLWYACLGVAAYCADGEALGHEWSSGYDGYTSEETQSRLDRARSLSGATTCEKFHSLDAKTCEACAHWQKIKSPISLGYGNGQVGQHEASASQTNIFGQPIKTQEVTDLPPLPANFFWSKDRALVTRTEGGRGNSVDIVVSSYPIYLSSVQTGEIKGEWTFIFRQFIPERGDFDIAIPATVLFGSQSTAELASRGANVHDHATFIRYVRAAIDLYYKDGKLTTRYDQFGWKQDDTAFLYGLDLYSGSGIKRVTGNDELQIRCKEDWVGPCKGGDLAAWKQSINSLFALGCEPQSVALLASFAAPLMRFLERDEGGAIIHLVTRESGTGKSTALIGAASVWGRREGLGLTNDDTRVTKALTLGALGNLPVIHDELTLRDPEAIRAFVITFTNGRDKMRATRAGEIKHTASTWQTILLSAANNSLVDSLSVQNDPEAAAMRILEFRLELPDGLRHVQGDKLRRALRENSGHAGKVYLDYLVHNLPWIKQALETLSAQAWRRTGLDAKYRFWIRTIAAIGVAGIIVKHLGLVDFSIERIMNWLFEQVKENKFTSSPWAMSTLAEFLNQHQDATLVVPRPYAPKEKMRPLREPRQRLAIRYEVSVNRYFVTCTVLREWLITKDRSYRELIDQLEKDGVVTRRQAQVTLGAGTDAPGGQTYCIEINGSHEALAGVAKELKDNVVTMART